MTRTVSTLEIRKHLGDILNRVELRHDQFIIERKGKPLAALVPVEVLEQVKEGARKRLAEFYSNLPPSDLTEEEADRLANEAVRWARRTRKR